MIQFVDESLIKIKQLTQEAFLLVVFGIIVVMLVMVVIVLIIRGLVILVTGLLFLPLIVFLLVVIELLLGIVEHFIQLSFIEPDTTAHRTIVYFNIVSFGHEQSLITGWTLHIIKSGSPEV
jgi:type IV secretory pathway VirB3-like protein